MAIEYIDNCCGCPGEMGCLGSDCPQRNVRTLVCDKCGQSVRELHELNSDWQLCADCLLDEYKKICLD